MLKLCAAYGCRGNYRGEPYSRMVCAAYGCRGNYRGDHILVWYAFQMTPFKERSESVQCSMRAVHWNTGRRFLYAHHTLIVFGFQ